jgi:hypothetical protein
VDDDYDSHDSGQDVLCEPGTNGAADDDYESYDSGEDVLDETGTTGTANDEQDNYDGDEEDLLGEAEAASITRGIALTDARLFNAQATTQEILEDAATILPQLKCQLVTQLREEIHSRWANHVPLPGPILEKQPSAWPS